MYNIRKSTQSENMKKLLLIAMFASVLMSAEKGWYIGIDGYKTRTNTTVSNALVSEKQNLTRSSKTFKAGYYVSRGGRTNIYYQRSDTMDDTKGYLYGVGYDYLIGSYPLKPYLGVLLGYSRYTQPDVTVDGGFVGVNMGLNYAFSENFSLEAGYRYMFSNASGDFAASLSKAKADSLTNWYLGANYKF
jgi:opacity protein-like surface antigen